MFDKQNDHFSNTIKDIIRLQITSRWGTIKPPGSGSIVEAKLTTWPNGGNTISVSVTYWAQKDFFPFTYMEKETSVTRWIIFLSVQIAAKCFFLLSGFDSLGLITFGKSRRVARLNSFIPLLASEC